MSLSEAQKEARKEFDFAVIENILEDKGDMTVSNLIQEYFERTDRSLIDNNVFARDIYNHDSIGAEESDDSIVVYLKSSTSSQKPDKSNRLYNRFNEKVKELFDELGRGNSPGAGI